MKTLIPGSQPFTHRVTNSLEIQGIGKGEDKESACNTLHGGAEGSVMPVGNKSKSK